MDLILGLVSLLRSCFGAHFSYEHLLAHRDNEFGPFTHWCMEIHLRRCGICAGLAGLIEKGLQIFAKMDSAPLPLDILNLSESLRKLRCEIDHWEAVNQVTGQIHKPDLFTIHPIAQLIKRELGLYLGIGAASSFLSRLGAGGITGPGLLGNAESVLRDFSRSFSGLRNYSKNYLYPNPFRGSSARLAPGLNYYEKKRGKDSLRTASLIIRPSYCCHVDSSPPSRYLPTCLCGYFEGINRSSVITSGMRTHCS